MNDIRLTLDAIIAVLGEPTSSIPPEHFWQCPYCNDEGHDNMMFNEDKQILWCFASEQHSKRMYARVWSECGHIKEFQEGTKLVRPVVEIEHDPQLRDYLVKCNKVLMYLGDKSELAIMERGIRFTTLRRLGVGIDFAKSVYTFPCVTFDGRTFGAEFRSLDMKPREIQGKMTKAWKRKGTKSGLVKVNSLTLDTRILIITEGFIDAYTLVQYLHDNNKDHEYLVITPTNGVWSIHRLLGTIPYEKFDKVVLMLDNDKAGREATRICKEWAKINELAHKFTHYSLEFAGYKDYNEYYNSDKRGVIHV